MCEFVCAEQIECIALIEDQEALVTPWCGCAVDKMDLEWEEDCPSMKDQSSEGKKASEYKEWTESDQCGLRSYACCSNSIIMGKRSPESQEQPR